MTKAVFDGAEAAGRRAAEAEGGAEAAARERISQSKVAKKRRAKVGLTLYERDFQLVLQLCPSQLRTLELDLLVVNHRLSLLQLTSTMKSGDLRVDCSFCRLPLPCPSQVAQPRLDNLPLGRELLLPLFEEYKSLVRALPKLHKLKDVRLVEFVHPCEGELFRLHSSKHLNQA